MSDHRFEKNKKYGAFFLAGLIMCGIGGVVDIFYPVQDPFASRNYKAASDSTPSVSAAAKEDTGHESKDAEHSAASEQTASAEPAAEEKKEEPAADIVETVKGLLAKANASEGEKVAAKCKSCHDFSKDNKNRVGPGLYGIVGRGKGAHSGYSYSSTLQGLGGNWDVESLIRFTHKPSEFAKGTKMTFAGISNPDDLADLIAYLETLK